VSYGKKGTEIAKSAADLILVDDDLSKMIVAVSAGRRIYTNLKKQFNIVSYTFLLYGCITSVFLDGYI
jgi:Ca2+-transporting ATPase